MAIFRPDTPINGSLIVGAESRPELLQLDFKPFKDPGPVQAAAENDAPVRLLEYDVSASRLLIYPINTFRTSPDFLQPKYEKIARFNIPCRPDDQLTDADQLKDLLEYLPRGFLKDFQYGLGLAKEYRLIINEVERYTECREILFSEDGPLRVMDESFVIGVGQYEELVKELDRITGRSQKVGRRVKEGHLRSVLGEHLGFDAPRVTRGVHPVIQLITDELTGQGPLDSSEQDLLIDAAVAESRRVAEERPGVLAKLRGDIELVALETIISQYEAALGSERLESYWQEFFSLNPFALHLAFGIPVIKIQEQASVGGVRLDGGGGKIADFLVKNSLTNNVGIIEIKKPGAPLLQTSAYRAGIYGPSPELAGSVSQVLDQRYQLEKSLGMLKEASRQYELESYSIRCCLVIGRTPESPDHKKSLELFRSNCKNVDVVSFDELLVKLKQLRDLLGPAVAAGS